MTVDDVLEALRSSASEGENAFFYHLAKSVRIEETNEPNVVGYLAWNKDYNDLFIKLNFENIKKIFSPVNERSMMKAAISVLKHELLHYALLHWKYNYKDECDRFLSNISQDSLINPMIPEIEQIESRDFPYKLSAWDYVNKNFPANKKFILYGSGLSNVSSLLKSDDDIDWESLKKILEKYFQCKIVYIPVPGSGKNPSPSDAYYDYDEVDDSKSAAEIEKKVKSNVKVSILKSGKLQGTRAGDLLSELYLSDEEKEPIAEWKKILRSFLGYGIEAIKVPSWKRFSKRYGIPPYWKMKYYNKKKWKTFKNCDVTVLIDVSGSVSDDLIVSALKEVVSASKNFGLKVKMYTYDVRITGEITLSDIEKKRIKIKGRGGTNLNRALRNAEFDLADSVVIFTDGYDNIFDMRFFEKKRLLVIYYPNHNRNHLLAMKSAGAFTAVLTS